MHTLNEILQKVATVAGGSRAALYRDLAAIGIKAAGKRRKELGRPLALYPDNTVDRVLAHRGFLPLTLPNWPTPARIVSRAQLAAAKKGASR